MAEKYTDVRHLRYVELLERCADCKGEFVVRLHLRQQCGECSKKAYEAIRNEPIFGDAWRKLWEQFDKVMKAAFRSR